MRDSHVGPRLRNVFVCRRGAASANEACLVLVCKRNAPFANETLLFANTFHLLLVCKLIVFVCKHTHRVCKRSADPSVCKHIGTYLQTQSHSACHICKPFSSANERTLFADTAPPGFPHLQTHSVCKHRSTVCKHSSTVCKHHCPRCPCPRGPRCPCPRGPRCPCPRAARPVCGRALRATRARLGSFPRSGSTSRAGAQRRTHRRSCSKTGASAGRRSAICAILPLTCKVLQVCREGCFNRGSCTQGCPCGSESCTYGPP